MVKVRTVDMNELLLQLVDALQVLAVGVFDGGHLVQDVGEVEIVSVVLQVAVDLGAKK